jgi:hypothetical protein
MPSNDQPAACVFPRCVEGEKPPHCGSCEGRATPYAHEYGSSAVGRFGPVRGHIDRASGEKCGWANGSMVCRVPGCKFSEERCVLVQRQRREASRV